MLAFLRPVQQRFHELEADPGFVRDLLAKGAVKAATVANAVLVRARARHRPARALRLTADEARQRLSRRFRGQAASCADLGSPLYADLLARAADNLDGGGAVWRVVEPFAGVPGGALLALRYLGATHRQALSAGAAPALAARYPSCGGDGDPDGAWAALLALSSDAASSRGLDRWLSAGCRPTRSVGRAALLGGFLAVQRATGLPLRLLEVGASAGLNLRWDLFRYEGWGPPPTSPGRPR